MIPEKPEAIEYPQRMMVECRKAGDRTNALRWMRDVMSYRQRYAKRPLAPGGFRLREIERFG